MLRPLLCLGHSDSMRVGFVMWNKGLFLAIVFDLMINSMALVLTWSWLAFQLKTNERFAFVCSVTWDVTEEP